MIEGWDDGVPRLGAQQVTFLEKLNAMLAKTEKATPGPWEWTKGRGHNSCEYNPDNEFDCRYGTLFSGENEVGGSCDGCRNVFDKEDADFIAAVRTNYPRTLRALVKAVESLERLNKELTIPAAEYVPAIAASFTILDSALGEIEKELGNPK